MAKEQNGLGAVMIVVVSPTRTLLVREMKRKDPYWKCPGGSIEEGESVLAAAIREVREETGIELLPDEVQLYSPERTDGEVYYPNFCVAIVSVKKLGTHAARTYENDDPNCPMEIALFLHQDVLELNLLPRHRPTLETLFARV